MRLKKRFPFAARAWQVLLLAFAVCASGLAAGHAPVARTGISADVLLALLGSGKAIEIGLPDDVRVVHVVATRGDEVVIERRTEIGVDPGGRAESIVVSVGAVGPTLRCPLLVFIRVDLEREGRAYGGGMNASCIEVDAPAALWPTHVGFLEPSFEVGTWYAVEGFIAAQIGAGAPRPTPDDAIVFHVYLATDDADAPIEELAIGPR